jgi:hypothetical protein
LISGIKLYKKKKNTSANMPLKTNAVTPGIAGAIPNFPALVLAANRYTQVY